MKQYCIAALSLAFLLLSCTDDRDIAADPIYVNPESKLVHYWNFNSLAGAAASIDADFSLTGGATITYPGTGNGYMDDFEPGYPTNARNGDDAGRGFRARNPSNTRSILVSLPTTGHKDIIVRFATSRTGSGAATQTYSYSIDGVNFVSGGLNIASHNPIQEPANSLVSIDFSAIMGVNDNSLFRLKIDFSGDTVAGDQGNNRFDNLTLEGVPIGTIDNAVYLFHYWNFNTISGTLVSIPPDASLIAGSSAAITYDGTGTAYIDDFSPGSTENARNGDAPGSGLRARNPSNTRSLKIAAPTTGYKEVVVKFATAKSSASGASVQNYSYTTDGVTFTAAGLPVANFSPAIDPVYNVVTLDFSGIPAVNNNPMFAVKIDFSGPEASGTSGNNRFDNLTFEGKHL